LDEDTKNNAGLHLWSLSVEEQFYLLWPVLLLKLKKLNSKYKYSLISGLAIFTVISFFKKQVLKKCIWFNRNFYDILFCILYQLIKLLSWLFSFITYNSNYVSYFRQSGKFSQQLYSFFLIFYFYRKNQLSDVLMALAFIGFRSSNL